ncbi:MAG: chemotaxis protein CheW [Akkermansiaceae bacterium]|nr:chemotaxis protein CheW [Akkermansiaceae bacterium]
MSRTTGGDYLLGSEEKEALRRMMWRMAEFCGVKLLTYCVMDNHFHMLVRVPSQEKFLRRFDDRDGEEPGAGEERLMGHLSTLYSKAYIKQLRAEIAMMREMGLDDDVVQFLGRYKKRFCDLSLFVKEVKERFSRWYNKKHSRRGTLWMERFKSVLVENGEALQTMAAYIDLNPVRAGLVEDPKDYRFCGYAEAVGGSKRARRGLCRVMGKPLDSWSANGSWYRCWLMIDGEEVQENKTHEVRAKKGMAAETVEKELARGGELSKAEQLRSRVSYFTAGIALGSRGFVDALFHQNRGKFGPQRKRGAKPVAESPKARIENGQQGSEGGDDSCLYVLK